jgi:hypothetical protein
VSPKHPATAPQGVPTTKSYSKKLFLLSFRAPQPRAKTCRGTYQRLSFRAQPHRARNLLLLLSFIGIFPHSRGKQSRRKSIFIPKSGIRIAVVVHRRVNLWGKTVVRLGEKKAYYETPLKGVEGMADRKQLLHDVVPDPELAQILERSKGTAVTEAELREQRISFAYGNAPQSSEHRITKESIKAASEHIKLRP